MSDLAADLALARSLFAEYIDVCQAEARATTPQVRAQLAMAVKIAAGALSVAGLDAYFDGRVSVRELASVHHAGQLATLAVSLRHGDPLWVAGFADGLLEKVGA